MPNLTNKIDFAVIFTAKNANPNGDPLNGNRPRQNNDGFGEVSDVCLKRKLRNRLLSMGESIFVQSDENRNDECRSLNERFEAFKEELKCKDDKAKLVEEALKKWFDVRAFGQVFAFKEKKGAKKKKGQEQTEETEQDTEGNSGSVSIGIRGPITIQSAFSIDQVTIESLQITKSVNLETNEKNPEVKGSDTMGMKHRVNDAVYVTYGAINTQLASKTGFSDEDAEKIKKALKTLFVDDASSARPEGSMEVLKVIWWKHNCPTGQYSSAKVHRSLKDILQNDGTYDSKKLKEALPDLMLEEIDGM